MKLIDTRELQEAFLKARNITLVGNYDYKKAVKEQREKPFNKNNRYVSYCKKLEEERFEDFKSYDIVYFFRDKANEHSNKYVISNWNKECAIAKRAIERYSAEEVCLMIAFLFESEQNYLDKSSLSLGIIVSGWCNTIYRDATLWLDDKYIPRKKVTSRKKEALEKREFKKSEEEETSIGEW